MQLQNIHGQAEGMEDVGSGIVARAARSTAAAAAITAAAAAAAATECCN